MDSIKHVILFKNYAFEYRNYKEIRRKKTNEELIEGWMRSDFTANTVKEITYDSLRVVRL